MGQKETAKVLHASTGGVFCPASLFLTAAVTFLLVATVQAVGVGVAVPSQRDAVAVFALELVAVALHLAAVLCGTTKDCARECQQGATVRRSGKKAGALPHPIRRRSRGLHHTSSGRQCNGHWCRRTRSPNTGEALGGTQGESGRRSQRGRKHGGGGGSRNEARRGVKEEKRKQGAEQTASPRIKKIHRYVRSQESLRGGNGRRWESGRS